MKYLVIGIIILAATLRLVGIIPGYPPYHPDEGMSYSQAVGIIKEHSLDANGYSLHYAYPGLIPIVNAVSFETVFIPLSWLKYYLVNFGKVIDGVVPILFSGKEYDRIFQLYILGNREINALYWGRITAALFGIGVVYLTYHFSKVLFNKRIGLISALLVAINYRQVLNSHFDLPDIYNAFFLLFSLICSYSIVIRPTIKNYLLAGIFAALFFSTKFHFYAFLPLMLAHLFTINSKDNIFRQLINSKIFISGLVLLLMIFILNPYHLIHWEETIVQLTLVTNRYAVGTKILNTYPYSYLYFIGIGKLTSLSIIIGFILMLVTRFKKFLYLTSVIIPFFFIVTYYTNGGFYTRNFVTITPVLLIFPAYLICFLFGLISKRLGKWIAYPALLVLLILLGAENLPNSMVVAKEYSKPWNIDILSSWLTGNMEKGSRIAAEMSVNLPIENVQRYSFDFNQAFCLDEFDEEGAEYSITNLDWEINDFHWWMGGNIYDGFKYWKKPVDILEDTFPALALREQAQSTIFQVVNPWQSPDSNYIVSKIPKYTILDKEKIIDYDFNDSLEGWTKEGKMWFDDDNLDWKNGMLIISKRGASSPIVRWESQPIYIKDWPYYLIDAKMKTENNENKNHEGFMAVFFFNSLEDALNQDNRVGVRLSSRNAILNEWTQKELSGIVPENVKYMRLIFSAYNKTLADIYLDSLVVYKASIDVDWGGWEIKPYTLDQNVLFPNSAGGM